MRTSQGTWCSDIPSYTFATLPGNERAAVRSPAVRLQKPCGFFHCWKACFCQGPVYDIVQQAMPNEPSLIVTTCKAMGTSGIDKFTAYASVGCTEATAKPDTNRDPDCLIVKSETNCRDGKGLQPVPRVWIQGNYYYYYYYYYNNDVAL